MKIVHLATSLGGGAGIAARRIADAQLESNMDVSLLALNGGSAKLNKHERIISTTPLITNSSKALTILQSVIVQKDLRLTTPLSISRNLLHIKEIEDADIVHVHAFYNLVSVRELLALSNQKNLVVTLHDQRFFTGGCHYSFECEGFQKSCTSCPQVRKPINALPGLMLRKSVQASKNAKSITFITPSKWLSELAMSSTLLNRREFAVLPNPIPEDFTADKIKRHSENKIRLGFISENLNNPYKGLSLLIDALSKVSNPERFELLLFGHGNPPALPKDIEVNARSFTDISGSVEAYRSCDVIVVPSLQDNSPSVISESLMCGVPVLGSDTGGISEILREFEMPIFESGNLDSLVAALERLEITPISEANQERIRIRYSYLSSAKAHKDLYSSLMRGNITPTF